VYSPKTHNPTSSLNTLCTAESAQFYFAFSATTISLTLRFHRKREVWLRFFAENAQNDLKTHSYVDSAKFNSAFLATTLSHASRFWRKRGVIENFEYLDEFEEYFRKCWVYFVLYLLVTERCNKKFKNRLWKSRACVPLRTTRRLGYCIVIVYTFNDLYSTLGFYRFNLFIYYAYFFSLVYVLCRLCICVEHDSLHITF
jgi:hypothetical protein